MAGRHIPRARSFTVSLEQNECLGIERSVLIHGFAHSRIPCRLDVSLGVCVFEVINPCRQWVLGNGYPTIKTRVIIWRKTLGATGLTLMFLKISSAALKSLIGVCPYRPQSLRNSDY